MKKLLIIAALAMSAMFGTGIASADTGDAKYFVNGQEVSYEYFMEVCNADWVTP